MALISFLCERYNSYKKQKRARAKSMIRAKVGRILPEKFEGYLTLCTDNPSPTYLRNYKFNKILIKAMAEYCKAKGI